ncbi:TetR/AcrR family transcriptional regulator [Streptomyces erythrochromogenes]|uniref:TetR/AcrR family transcriptional regulator n=1 Tax=Streptomyces erythrochromogenes TaxID=285574 RepID=A0ABZ1Q7Y6_9ACTN|nr:TetR/AcrR family transcriptional regulator [Streptomyces erythrochromogenes]MCX5582056.1 TetR/AcrR family transcriptional regulator [Streptomyces erythrochromogenes]
MPLPRFDRLPAERREHILGVARRHFAEHGAEGASYNKIIEAAGVSKTAAYHYFDGREDLLTAVLDGVLDRLLDALGPWEPARDEGDFESRFAAGATALGAHLGGHPEDLALADAAIGRASGGPWLDWFGALVADGRRLGLIRTDVDPSLMVAATAAVIRAADAWALARRATAPDPGGPSGQLWTLLRGLWGAAPTGQEPDHAL